MAASPAGRLRHELERQRIGSVFPRRLTDSIDERGCVLA
jgi:hypothetical protein